MHLAHLLVQGVDLWLNLPRVPLEASRHQRHEGGAQRRAAAQHARRLVAGGLRRAERVGHPARRARPRTPTRPTPSGSTGCWRSRSSRSTTTATPRASRSAWVERMRHALRLAGSRFTARRMVQDYVQEYYAAGDARRGSRVTIRPRVLSGTAPQRWPRPRPRRRWTSGGDAGHGRPPGGGVLPLRPHRRPRRGGQRARAASSTRAGPTSWRSCRSTARCATRAGRSSRSGGPFRRRAGRPARGGPRSFASGRAARPGPRCSSSSTSTTSTAPASTARAAATIPTTRAASPSSRSRRSTALPAARHRARCCCTPTTGTRRSRRSTSAPRSRRPPGADASRTVLSVHNPGYQGHFPAAR